MDITIYDKLTEFMETRKYIVLTLVFSLCLFILGVSIYLGCSSNREIKFDAQQVAQSSSNKTGYSQQRTSTSVNGTVETFEAALLSTDNGDEVFNTSDTYLAYVQQNALFQDQSASFVQERIISDANASLLKLAEDNYKVYFDDKRVSPIYPLAVANVETPGRADNNITWSALFPSRWVSVDKMYTFNVTDVLNLSDEGFKALTTEHSTRDRGALQMSATYGTGNSEFNKLMSASEKSKLAKVDTSRNQTWANLASDQAGDRFYIPDVLLRLGSANTTAIQHMKTNGYEPSTDMQLICQLAMFHHRSGVWYNSNHSKFVGEWKSGEVAYQYSKLISSLDMYTELSKYAIEHDDVFNINNKDVTKIFKNVTGQSFDSFASSDLVCLYPLKVEYAYIKLCLLYGG